MKKKRVLSVLLMMTMVVGMCAACSKGSTTTTDDKQQAEEQEVTEEPDEPDVTGDDLQEEQDGQDVQDSEETEVTDAQGAGASSSGTSGSDWDVMVDKLFETDDTKNIMVSPLSLNLALVLLREGAGDGTASAEALDEYLGSDYRAFAEDYMNNRIQDFNFVSEGYDYESDESVEYNEAFEIANSAWVSDFYTISDSYSGTIQDRYNADISSFSIAEPEVAADAMNGWVDEKTHSMIKKIINPDRVTPDLDIVLMNTVYVESGWVDTWSISGPDQTKFTNQDGTVSDTDMLSGSGDRYFENDYATAFSKRYKNGLQFIGILPKKEGDFTLEELDIEGLLDSEKEATSIYARMPKLNFASELDLTEYFKSGVLEPAFRDGCTDFSDMLIEYTESIRVSGILQNTKLELDEYGTKAAAVTAILMDAESALMDTEYIPREVIMDRPFAFLIYDDRDDVVVFAGKVVTADQ